MAAKPSTLRKNVEYPDMSEYPEDVQAEIVQAINNHEDWGAKAFTLLAAEDHSVHLDLRKNSKGVWIIW